MESEEESLEDNLDYELSVSPWRRTLQIVAGIIFIIAILYFSGIYQYFLFRETPEKARPDTHEKIVDGQELLIPINFYIIDGVTRDEKNVQDMTDKASEILFQAGITIEVLDTYEINTEDSAILNSLGDRRFLDGLPNYDPGVITAVLSKTLAGLNGVALGQGGVLAVAEYTAGFDFRTLAHEIGHILGLGHTENPSRLMNSGGRGERLTLEEALTMRRRAQSFIEKH